MKQSGNVYILVVSLLYKVPSCFYCVNMTHQKKVNFLRSVLNVKNFNNPDQVLQNSYFYVGPNICKVFTSSLR